MGLSIVMSPIRTKKVTGTVKRKARLGLTRKISLGVW